MILAIRRASGEMIREQLDKVAVEAGDSLIVLGRKEGLPEFLKTGVTDTELI